MGGKAIKSSSPVLSKNQMVIADDVMDTLSDGGINARMRVLGSTGKKKDGDYSGDIDIAVETGWDDSDKVLKILEKKYGKGLETYPMKAYNILSVGIPYSASSEEKVAQVDLMFTHNMDFCEFMNWSPDFRSDESKFKGLYRTNLIEKCASHVDLNLIEKDLEELIELPEGFTTEKTFAENGDVESFWGLALDHSKGLNLHHYTFKGSSGKKLKHPQKIKGDSILVTDDPDEIIELCVGSTADRDTVATFENIVDYLTSGESDRFRTKEELDKLFIDYSSDPRQTQSEMDSVEIDEYINQGMKKW